MSDLATILDLQGHHDDALALVRRAVELSRSAGHPDLHVLLGNMAGILLHTGEQGTEIGGGSYSARLTPSGSVPQAGWMTHCGSTRRLWVWPGRPQTRRLWTGSRRD